MAPMFTKFEAYIKERTKLTDQQVQLMLSVAITRKLSKHEELLKQGDICRHKTFVVQGLLRGYRVNKEGTPHTIWFTSEGLWTVDADSYHHHTPSKYIIDALEDTEVILWSKQHFDELLIAIPELKIFSDRIVSTNFSLTRERMFSALTASPEEKYNDFVKDYPGVFARIPLHLVASYLGVSLKTITRIRHAQVKR
jgi:CRP-like cAMP-binding protein